MPTCFFILLRHWLRVDNVVSRLRDTRPGIPDLRRCLRRASVRPVCATFLDIALSTSCSSGCHRILPSPFFAHGVRFLPGIHRNWFPVIPHQCSIKGVGQIDWQKNPTQAFFPPPWWRQENPEVQAKKHQQKGVPGERAGLGGLGVDTSASKLSHTQLLSDSFFSDWAFQAIPVCVC